MGQVEVVSARPTAGTWADVLPHVWWQSCSSCSPSSPGECAIGATPHRGQAPVDGGEAPVLAGITAPDPRHERRASGPIGPERGVATVGVRTNVSDPGVVGFTMAVVFASLLDADR